MLTSQDLHSIRTVVREGVCEEIQNTVPSMIESGIQKSVPGMMQDVVHREIEASELRLTKQLTKQIKLFVHSEHVKTRATINEVVDYFDKRVRVTEHRLDRVERTLDLPKFSN